MRFLDDREFPTTQDALLFYAAFVLGWAVFLPPVFWGCVELARALCLCCKYIAFAFAAMFPAWCVMAYVNAKKNARVGSAWCASKDCRRSGSAPGAIERCEKAMHRRRRRRRLVRDESSVTPRVQGVHLREKRLAGRRLGLRAAIRQSVQLSFTKRDEDGELFRGLSRAPIFSGLHWMAENDGVPLRLRCGFSVNFSD